MNRTGNKNKFLTLIVMAVFAMGIVGCGNKDKDKEESKGGGVKISSDSYLGMNTKWIVSTLESKVQPMDVLNNLDASSMSKKDEEEYQKLTSLQREKFTKDKEKKLTELNGSVVLWEIPVINVEKNDRNKNDGIYVVRGEIPLRIRNSDAPLHVKVVVEPKDKNEIDTLEGFKRGQRVWVKGTIERVDFAMVGNLVVLKPAIVLKPGVSVSVNAKSATPEVSGQNAASKEASVPQQVKPVEQAPAQANQNPQSQPNSMASANRGEVSGVCAGLNMNTPNEYLECSSRQLTEADMELNGAYKRTMATLNLEQKARLKSDEIAWIRSKQATCNKGDKAAQNACATTMTKDRTDYLKDYQPR